MSILVYPPNTKDAKVTIHKSIVIVACPHCGKTHHHNKAILHLSWAKAKCGKGFYVLKNETKKTKGK